MINVLEIGPIKLHIYGLIVGLAMVVGYWWAEKKAKTYGITAEKFQRSTLVAIACGLVGARLYHVIDYWNYYVNYPMQILAVWYGGLAIWGGVLGGLVGIWWGSEKKTNYRIKMLDSLAVAMPLSQAIGRWGNWINGELYGKATLLPWGIRASEGMIKYHPLFAYEAGLNLILFWMINFKLKRWNKLGQKMGIYLVGYGVIRFCLEPLRINPWLWGKVPVAEIVSLLAIIAGIFIIRKNNKGINHL